MNQEEPLLSLKDQFLLSSLGQWIVLHKKILINVGIVALSVLIFVAVKIAQRPSVRPLRPMNEEELRRVAPLHAESAAVSAIVEKKAYQEALEKSVSLKERLPEKTILYGQNLLRIASLQKELNNSAGEFAAWVDFERFVDQNASLSDELLKSLGDQKANFFSYIEYRKSQLQN